MKKYIPLTVGLLAVALLLAFAVGQGSAQQASPESGQPANPQAPTKSSLIPIQGRLTDPSGNPLTGSYDLIFNLYDIDMGGTALCTNTASGVIVVNGLFNAYMNMQGCSAIDGRQLYLGIQVGTDPEMTPRQTINNVIYAWTLRPGANISSTIGTDAILDIDNYSPTGRGLRAEAQATTGENMAVVGASRSPDGYGGYFYNNGGGVGLLGEATSTNGGAGIFGKSAIASGVYGESTSGFGIYGHSTSNWAVYGDTGRGDHNYGLYTADNLYSANYHLMGAVMQVVQNGGSEPLEAGDVVVFSGMVPPTDANEPPVILVSKATAANSTAVAGVVYSRYSLESATVEGAAQPGEYLLVVVQGPARVKVSAVAGTIQPGDLLSSSAQAGVAANAVKITTEGVQIAAPGIVFAKALEALESGKGWIYVFVTLQ